MLPASSKPEGRPTQLRVTLDEIKAAILCQQSSLVALETQQRELEMKLSLVVYPVLTLPMEILAHIFVGCLPRHGRVRPSAHMPPLTLAHICGQWRDIALSTPELWSSVDLAFASRRTRRDSLLLNQEETNHGAHPLLEMWFSRAKGRPLSWTIRSS